ncbi:MAG TPA: TonB-dependent receptor [Cyclobacteriaceae bacterium]
MKGPLLTLMIIATASCFAQTKVSGRVMDEKGEGIPGANVSIKDSYDGASSNVEGKFEFTTPETGEKLLVITFVGYKNFEKEIDLNGVEVKVDAYMKETINELQAVTITAGAFGASDESRRTIFRAVDIATTAGATADIAGALNTLPGTQKVGESGRLFVRGGDGYEARTFIDGMIVMNEYDQTAPNTPSRGRFLPFMFKGTSFSTGGYSAEYGQALSSALVLDSRDKSEMTRTDFGLLSVGADVTQTQVWDRGSVAAKIQYTDIRPYFGLINQEIDWKDAPVSLEGSSAFRQQVGKDGMVKVFGNFSHSTYSLYSHDIADESLKQLYDFTNDYTYLNGFYKQSLSDKWSMRGGISYTFNRNNSFLDADQTIDIDRGLHVKAVLEGSLSEHVEIKTGAEILNKDYHHSYDPETAIPFQNNFSGTITAAFAETDVYASNRFVTRLGARTEYNNLINKASIDPRISLAYKTGEVGQVSLAYGKFRQSPKNEWVRVNNKLQSEKADHYILNYQVVTHNRTFRVETYYKKYNDLVKFRNGNSSDLTNDGNGFAKGVELFWRDNRSIKNVDYWVSYSYLDTERNFLNTPYSVTPTFASAHNFSVVYKHFVTKLKTQFGATYSVTSGRPYNDPNMDEFNAGKTTSYQDLSVNISYLPTSQLILYFSCTNVLGRDNIFGYEFSNTPDADGVYASRPIRQPAPRFLFLGIFITLSKEKTVNQLPTL